MGNCAVRGTTVSNSMKGVPGDAAEASSTIAVVEESCNQISNYLRRQQEVSRAKLRAQTGVEAAFSPCAASDLGGNVQVLPSMGKGVWRVKLVLSAQQLAEILSEESNTEALIEMLRICACMTETRRTQSKNIRAAAGRKPMLPSSHKIGPSSALLHPTNK